MPLIPIFFYFRCVYVENIYILSNWCVRRLRSRERALTNSTFSRFDGSRFFLGWHENRPNRGSYRSQKIRNRARVVYFRWYLTQDCPLRLLTPLESFRQCPFIATFARYEYFLVNGSNTARKVIREYNDLIVNPLSTVWCHQGAITGNAADFYILLRYIIAQNASTWLTAVIALLYRVIFSRFK